MMVIAQSMQQKVKANWERLSKKTGFTVAEIEKLHRCFIACDEKIDHENGE